MLLVVVVDLADRDNSGVGRSLVVSLWLVLLVPVEDSSDERRDEGHLGLRACNGLLEAEEQREVAVNRVFRLEFTCSLDALPSGCNLDKNAVL